MRLKPLIMAGVVGAGALLALGGANATPASMSGAQSAETPLQALLQPAQWRPYCARWRRICADRWGWGTWRFRRCVYIHGCRGGY